MFVDHAHSRWSGVQPALACIALTLIWTCDARAGAGPGDWTGDYPPCDRHAELSSNERMKLGIRFYTAVPEVKAAFVRAMEFWATVLDME
jgi:hypothetical protein